MEAVIPAEAAAALDRLYPRFAQSRFTAGWHSRSPAVWPQPRTEFRPQHWSYAQGRAFLDEAGELISPQQAERRNLVMFNPVGQNDYFATPTMMAAYQMIKPGEYARNHRHTPNALRVVIDTEDEGIFTVVDGVSLPMRRGDVMLTPGWCWHSHFNQGARAGYWLDVLDVPLVHLLQPMFFEPGGAVEQSVQTRQVDHPFRIETLPLAAAARQALDGAPRWHSQCLPAGALKTLGLNLHTAAQTTAGATLQSVENRVYTVIEGSGRTHFGEEVLAWERGDVIVAPMWTAHSHCSDGAATLLEITDRPVYQQLGFFRSA